MRKQLFGFIGFSKSTIILFACLGLAVFTPYSRASQVVAFGYNMGVAPELTNAKAVSVIGYSLAALRGDGSVAQWGNTASDPGVSNVVSIFTGWSHGFGLRADGTLAGWGDDSGGGISGAPPGLTNAVAIGVGSQATLAVLDNGSVIGWGDNSYGLLNIPPDLTNIVALTAAAFGDSTVVLRADGAIVEWNVGATNYYPDISNIVAVAASSYAHIAVLHADGHVTAWPNNPPDDFPPANLTNIIAITGGGSHLLALHDDGTVTAWGCDCHSDFDSTATLTNVTAIAAGGGDGYDYSIFLIGHSNPPPVLSINLSNDTAHVTISGEAFRRYVVEETAEVNLSGGWAFKQNVVLPATAQTTLPLPIAGNARFYRARLMP